MNTFTLFSRKPIVQAGSPNSPVRPAIVRAFIETGDERCPLAGIWSRFPSEAAATDEPELSRPVMRGLLPWRALHLPLIFMRYSIG